MNGDSPSISANQEVPVHLWYFPSRFHAAVYRNWEIVPVERLAQVLGTSVTCILEAGESLGLQPPASLTPELIRRNYETVLRRNWPLLPRRQIEALLGWVPEQLDQFLATDIAFRVLLGSPPPDLTPVMFTSPDAATVRRAGWFAAQVQKHRIAVADASVEPRLDFIKDLSKAHDTADHLAGIQPALGDADLREGWSITIPATAGQVVETYARDFSDYCENVHGVLAVPIIRSKPGATGSEKSSRIVDLRITTQNGSPEAYKLTINPDSILIEGATELALGRGLMELERRMGESGAAFLTPTSGTLVMKPSFSPRFVYPYFAPMTDVLGQDVVDPCPEGYLARIAHQDADGIWLFCVLSDMVDSPAYGEMGHGSAKRRERLRQVVARAAKYGLKVYLYFNEPRAQPLDFFNKHPGIKGKTEGSLAAMCTSTDEVRQLLSSSFQQLFREVPGLAGVFLISASENLTHCYAHGRNIDCPRCKAREPEVVVAELIRCIADAVHKASPNAKVIAWDWSWHSVEMKDPQQEIVTSLKPDCLLMADFERGIPIERGGIPMTVDEYSISVVGPSPRAKVRAKQAADLGIPFLAKIQLSNTWECGTIPFIPVPGLLVEKASAMEKTGVTGCMESWTLGSCPSPNTEAFSIKQWNQELSVEEILGRVARRRYGDAATTHAVDGWTIFAKAFSEEYPYSAAIYNGPIQYAPGLPWFPKKIPAPYGHGAMLNPKDDYGIWTSPYSAAQMASQLRVMCDKLNPALRELEAVTRLAEPPRQATARKDYGVARIFHYTFMSFARTLDFYQARETGNVQEMKRLAKVEMTATDEAYRYVLQDSRLGWETQLQYYYQPSDVLEKLVSLEGIVAQER